MQTHKQVYSLESVRELQIHVHTCVLCPCKTFSRALEEENMKHTLFYVSHLLSFLDLFLRQMKNTSTSSRITFIKTKES